MASRLEPPADTSTSGLQHKGGLSRLVEVAFKDLDLGLWSSKLEDLDRSSSLP